MSLNTNSQSIYVSSKTATCLSCNVFNANQQIFEILLPYPANCTTKQNKS